MDQREKIVDPRERLQIAIEGLILGIMTAMPVQCISWDGESSVNVQPILQSRVEQQDGTYLWINQAVLINCPILFFGGAGCSITAPPQEGDTGLAIFSNRSIDEWRLAGGIQKRADLRSHHISDGFVLFGPRSIPDALASINPNAMEMRSNDGSTVVSVATSGVVAVKAPAGFSVTGNETVSGLLTAASLATDQTPSPSNTLSDHSVPIVLNGVTYYMRLSSTP